jgi:uncharacterized membrane protein HdeD (DUF308 family)
MFSSQFTDKHQTAFNQSSNRFLLWGIALVILGIIAVGAATMTTLISVIFLGFLLMFAGIMIVIDAFTFWRNVGLSFFLPLLLGVLYFAVGIMLIKSPILASISLTLFLGVFYLIIGLFRIISSFFIRIPTWGWGLFSGVISLILGILILTSWPQSGLYIIGLFIGIDLLFVGWTYIMASLAARSLTK